MGLAPRAGVAPAAAADSSNAEERVDRLIRLNNLGIAELAQFKESAALVAFHEALALDPDYAEAQTNLGIALLAAADYQAAETALRRGAELDPGSPYPRFTSGCSTAAREDSRALESFGRGSSPRADDRMRSTNSERCARGGSPAGVPAFRRALDLAPELSATYGLGRAPQAGSPDEGKKPWSCRSG